MGMSIQLNKKNIAQNKNSFVNSTPFDNRFGFWGVVTEVHPENCTVSVKMDNGFIIQGVRVASYEWVTVEKDKHLTGERHLPPINTLVFCVMPDGDVSSSFVLCSGFARQQATYSDFMQDGEDAQNIYEKVENSSWYKSTDYRTGTKLFKNKTDDEPTIQLSINQEDSGDEKINLQVHETKIDITKDDGVNFSTDKKLNITTEDETSINVSKKLNVSADEAISIKSSKTELIELGNSIETLGKMISDLLDNLSKLKTVGSPATHNASPDFIAQMTLLKTKWDKVFK